MSPALLLGIGALGGIGAVLRVAVARRVGGPKGTLVVNLTGAFALGVLVGAAVSDDAERLLATGLLGAYTTFSAWMLDTHRLGRRAGAANVAVSLALGLLAVWAGRELGAAL